MAKSSGQLAGHVARKRFGQNFLVSTGIIQQIVDAIAPRAGETVVEIGPGLGALTEPLLACIDHLQVVEIDRDLIARLRQCWPAERLTVHEGDALAFDFSALKRTGPLKIVGNLPYNISSPLLFHLVESAPVVHDMHFMLQKEVVDRMVAEPGSSAFGRLSVMLQYHYHMECLFTVPPDAFEPPPKVMSAIVRLIPRDKRKVGADEATALQGGRAKNALFAVADGDTAQHAENDTAKDEALFARIVAAAFGQRRKMLRNTLRGFINEADLTALDISPTARAEELGVGEYVRLANALTNTLTKPP
ncbi:16S rRNA methyltransferase [Rugosibacter aromaticivorans]|uniref:Ribosomal RNA small subunit methyltransferase A n=1 Tax=Rugosibacter aromaticivorans TaxID=1565605 RepID=A0A0C5J7H9_9PROT|nr:16S rRNA (adenine(1518)-N(6)/adenine(1519)-N(6))-dimethyltransferase RsmA [Rugosibacter aromaticivorans]AJP47594.1 16S rRNA methyltransferase [Rugosibacter aromaticivorans]TBR14619.1 MAG: 16S rRNA (adenine(1518)-N(6)/adenine(1519)-N(6))-dimethyltransferase RsmA [Rugosibacter sp.]